MGESSHSINESEEAKKLELYEAKLAEHEAKRGERAKAFDVRELARSSSEPRSFEHPKYGLIRYGVLTARDLFELGRLQDDEDRLITAIWKMLHKADKSVTKEDAANLPWDLVVELLRLSGLSASASTSEASPLGQGT